MFFGSITHWKQQLQSGAVTPTQLVEQLCEQIESSNPSINAIISWDKEAALKAAAEADISLPLGGIPILIKDNINVKGEPMRCASRMLENFIAPYDATCVERLKAAGAIPLGRANMDEFAMGSYGKNSAYGTTANPCDAERSPGGSSSGSAAAVASGMAIAALGSDTGGSIRQPASHCGIVGMKPSYGRISRYGLVAFASSLDQIGPLAQNVEDTALLLNALCGYDSKDSTSSPREEEDFTACIGQSVAGKKIGIASEYLNDGNESAVNASLQRAIAQLEAQGATVVPISLPHTEAVVSTYYIIACAEASSNLSRFDGIRYGHRSAEAKGLDELYTRSRSEGFGAEVKRRIILGTYVLSSGYYDAYYGRAQKVRTLIARDFTAAFEQVDFILGPVSPNSAPKLHNSGLTPLQTYLADIYTIPSNLVGLPAISIPCPQEEGQMPVGIQLIAPHYEEAALIGVAHALETSLNS